MMSSCGYRDIVFIDGKWVCSKCGHITEENFEDIIRVEQGEKEYKKLIKRKNLTHPAEGRN